MPGVSRRTLIASGAVMAGIAASEALPMNSVNAAAPEIPATEPMASVTSVQADVEAARTGTIADVKHVVILMQENRSFDHYFGTLGGVRGFGDTKAVQYPGGTNTFDQPDSSRSNGILRPFRMNTSKYDAQDATDLDHSWAGTHEAAHGGAWNRWVAAKGFETMGYFTRSDLPWQYALADAFTICDAYHCSVQGPTTPNRLHMWTGTNDPHGTHGGPVTINPVDFYSPIYTWTTYPERLQDAGVTWQVYNNDEVGYGDWLGDFGDNPLWSFKAYHDAQKSTDPKVHDLAKRGAVLPWKPDAGKGHSVSHVLSRFIAACKAGTLPTVSWVVAPRLYSEHPKGRPVDGAAYISGVLEAIWANKTLWESTVVLLNYDENDGFFDHVIPPMPPTGTADEFIDGEPIGLGPRLPLTVVSPWSRGGWTNSQVFDHTSILRFLEVVTGVAEPNISAWRREVCGDLTSCFDFTTFDDSVPHMPSISTLVDAANAEKKLPALKAPGAGTQKLPTQEATARRHRPLPYGPEAILNVTKTGQVSIHLTNSGEATVSYAVYRANVKPFAPVPILVKHQQVVRYAVGTSATGGAYDLAVHGPNGFLRTFSGTAHPFVARAAKLTTTAGGRLEVEIANHGSLPADFTVSDGSGSATAHRVAAGGRRRVTVSADDGWYDISVDSDGLAHRYAGRVDAA